MFGNPAAGLMTDLNASGMRRNGSHVYDLGTELVASCLDIFGYLNKPPPTLPYALNEKDPDFAERRSIIVIIVRGKKIKAGAGINDPERNWSIVASNDRHTTILPLSKYWPIRPQ